MILQHSSTKYVHDQQISTAVRQSLECWVEEVAEVLGGILASDSVGSSEHQPGEIRNLRL